MKPIDTLLSTVEWTPTGGVAQGGGRYATHSGVLRLLGLELRCYRLNDGEAVFDADDFQSAFFPETPDLSDKELESVEKRAELAAHRPFGVPLHSDTCNVLRAVPDLLREIRRERVRRMMIGEES